MVLIGLALTEQGHFYHIGGFKSYRSYNKQPDKIRSKRDPKEQRKRQLRNRMVYNDWGILWLCADAPTSVCELGKN